MSAGTVPTKSDPDSGPDHKLWFHMLSRFRNIAKRSACLIVLCSTLLPVAFLVSQKVHAEKVIPVWTYYVSPPYITAYRKGLNYDFIDLLNRFAKGQYRFELEPLPRTRINRNLNNKLSGIVLFVNWEWMGDTDKTHYLWSLPILHDRNEIVSRRHGKPPVKIDFKGPRSLQGMVFGGLTGRQYSGLEEAFKNGDIIRRNVRNEEQNLAMLMRGRIDVTSSAASVIHYKVRATGLENSVYFSPQPHFSYTRHFLITPDLKHIQPLLNEFIVSLEQNIEWRSIKDKYAVE